MQKIMMNGTWNGLKKQTSKAEVSNEAVSPSILLSLYSSKCSYKKEDTKTTKYEVWQYFEILHKMIRVRIDHCKTEMIITKNNLYSFRYKKKQNEEVEKPRVRQIEIKVCTGYLDCGKAVYD